MAAPEPLCQVCSHRHFPHIRCSICGHMPRQARFQPPETLKSLHKLTLHSFSRDKPSPAEALRHLAEATIIRRRVYCQELGWLPPPPFGHEQDDKEQAAVHVLGKVGDVAMGCGRWRLVAAPQPDAAVDPVSGAVLATAAQAAAGTVTSPQISALLAPGLPQPCVDRLLISPDYRARGFGLVLLMQMLSDVLSIGGPPSDTPGQPRKPAPGQPPSQPSGPALTMAERSGLPPSSVLPGCWHQVIAYCPHNRPDLGRWFNRQGFRFTGRVFSRDPSGACSIAPPPVPSTAGGSPTAIATAVDATAGGATGSDGTLAAPGAGAVGGPYTVLSPEGSLIGGFLEYSLNLKAEGLSASINGVFERMRQRHGRLPCRYDRMLLEGAEAEPALPELEEDEMAGSTGAGTPNAWGGAGTPGASNSNGGAPGFPVGQPSSSSAFGASSGAHHVSAGTASGSAATAGHIRRKPEPMTAEEIRLEKEALAKGVEEAKAKKDAEFMAKILARQQRAEAERKAKEEADRQAKMDAESGRRLVGSVGPGGGTARMDVGMG